MTLVQATTIPPAGYWKRLWTPCSISSTLFSIARCIPPPSWNASPMLWFLCLEESIAFHSLRLIASGIRGVEWSGPCAPRQCHLLPFSPYYSTSAMPASLLFPGPTRLTPTQSLCICYCHFLAYSFSPASPWLIPLQRHGTFLVQLCLPLSPFKLQPCKLQWGPVVSIALITM